MTLQNWVSKMKQNKTKQNKNKTKIILFLSLILAGSFFLILSNKKSQQVLGDFSSIPENGDVLLGANYMWTHFVNCTLKDTGILLTYHNPGVRDKVRDQLQKMKTNGVQSLRLVLFFQSSLTPPSNLPEGKVYPVAGGMVPSAGGFINEPYRTNLINYLSDVDSIGFKRLTVTFSPKNENDPMESYGDPRFVKYDPNKFSENWNFVKDIRTLTKQNFKGESVFDLLGEGIPWDDYTPSYLKKQIWDYDVKMLKKYNTAFGSNDVTIESLTYGLNTVQNYISIFKEANVSPAFIGLSFYPRIPKGTSIDDAKAIINATYIQLKKTKDLFASAGMNQPFAILETHYNNQYNADGFRRFVRDNPGKIIEIIEWPIVRGEDKCFINPPYSISEYMKVNTPVVTSSVLKTDTSPWSINFKGTHFRNGMMVSIFDIDGTRWCRIPVTIKNSNTITIQLPGNNPPSGCNRNTSCQLKAYVVEPITKLTSNQSNITFGSFSD